MYFYILLTTFLRLNHFYILLVTFHAFPTDFYASSSFRHIFSSLHFLCCLGQTYNINQVMDFSRREKEKKQPNKEPFGPKQALWRKDRAPSAGCLQAVRSRENLLLLYKTSEGVLDSGCWINQTKNMTGWIYHHKTRRNLMLNTSYICYTQITLLELLNAVFMVSVDRLQHCLVMAKIMQMKIRRSQTKSQCFTHDQIRTNIIFRHFHVH